MVVKGPISAMMVDGNFSVVVDGAKDNWKYKKQKIKAAKKGEYFRRVKDAELERLEKLAVDGVVIGYDPMTDDFCVQTSKPGGSLNFPREFPSGGQLLRLSVILGNNVQGKSKSIDEITLSPFTREEHENKKKGTSNMLMIQGAYPCLDVGESFTVNLGDRWNTDARPYDTHNDMFREISEIFGRNYTLHDESVGDQTKFRVSREEDSMASKTEIDTDMHTGDQILMMALVMYHNRKDSIPESLLIKTNKGRDYHLDALIMFGRLMGLEIRDNKPKNLSDLNKWLESDGKRETYIIRN